MTRKSWVLTWAAAGWVLAASSAAFSLYPHSWLARDTVETVAGAAAVSGDALMPGHVPLELG